MGKELIKYNNSKAEQKFYEYMREKYPKLIISKKGFPDFMVRNKKNEIVGFVEIKRVDLRDELRTEQIYFKNYCKKKKIPYQIWTPNMSRKEWKNYKYKQVWTQKTTNWEL